MFYKFVRFIGAWFVRLTRPVKVFGPRKFGKKRLVVGMNHLSGWDPILLHAYFKPQPHFWGKKELFKKKFGA